MASGIVDVLNACEVCGQDGFTDEKLQIHIQNVHLETSSACPFCNLCYLSSIELTTHVSCCHLDFLNYHKGKISESFNCKKIKKFDLIGGNNNLSDITTDNQDELHFKINKSIDKRKENVLICTSQSAASTKFSLDLKKIDSVQHDNYLVTNSDNTSNEEHISHCPICNIKEKSVTKLEIHINEVHLDSMSSNSRLEIEEIEMFSCPLCVRSFERTSDLELHFNNTHNDVLSPAKACLPSPANTDSENGACPVCNRSEFTTTTELSLHIDSHFSKKPYDDLICQDKLAEKNKEVKKAKYGMDNAGSFSQQSVSNMQRAVYSGKLSIADYYDQKAELAVAEQSGIDDGRSCTTGLLAPIRTICEFTKNVKAVHLCTMVNHFAASFGDRGWGCGFRNIQMLLSCLHHPTSFCRDLFLSTSHIPSITQIQKLIERAWKLGFDSQGCAQLGGKLTDTRKWIGATEVASLLASFKIKCDIIDCHLPTGSNGTHPELFDWCLNYFSKSADFKPPIYLQHQGHSRTIIGIEEFKNGSCPRLLILDPSHSPAQVTKLTITKTALSALHLIRKGINNMKAKQYQMVVVTGISQNEQDYEKSKVLQSIRIPKE